ncbi:hypothetical protein GALL_359510 [mine drainage metagenome]|uniref:Uncharacterized protein n=1 Tax=mine drainage metagenome TaxID=410659 RepID=A0A1J5QFP4_9ZZZZ
MAGVAQGLHQRGVEAVLQFQVCADIAPGAAEQPARRADGLLQGLAVARIAREHGGLRLRLAFAAHGAVRHDAAVVEQGQGGVQRVEGFAPGFEGVEVGRVEREADAAVLPGDAGVAQHHAGAEFPVDALDETHGAACAVDRAHPDGVAGCGGLGPGQGGAHVDVGGERVERGVAEVAGRVAGHAARVGDHLVAHAEGALGGLDEAMQVRVAFALGHAEALVDAEDHQRCQALRRWGQVVGRAVAQAHGERGNRLRRIGREVGRAHRAADAFELGADPCREAAAIEAVEPALGQRPQRLGERRLAQDMAGRWRCAADEERLGEAWRILQAAELLPGQFGLAGGDDHAVAGMADGVAQQPLQGQRLATPGAGDVKGFGPAADRAGDGERGLRAARRNGVEPGIALRGGQGGGEAAGVDGKRSLPGGVDEPEAVAADGGHVGVDHGDGGGRRDHGLDGVAAVEKDVAPGLGREVVRGDDHAAQGIRSVQHVCGRSKLRMITRPGRPRGAKHQRDWPGCPASEEPLVAETKRNWAAKAPATASSGMLVAASILCRSRAAGGAAPPVPKHAAPASPRSRPVCRPRPDCAWPAPVLTAYCTAARGLELVVPTNTQPTSLST